MRMNQLKPIKDKNRHSLGVSGTLLSISVTFNISVAIDGVCHEKRHRKSYVVRVDGPASRTIAVSTMRPEKGLYLRDQLPQPDVKVGGVHQS
jgi:hypothetical protein